MRHGVRQNKLNKKSKHRMAMLRNLSISLLQHEVITTTLPKAKALRPLVEKIITIAKKAGPVNLHARRQLIAKVGEVATRKLLDQDLATRYVARNGGYIRIIKNGFRYGDGAPLAVIKLV